MHFHKMCCFASTCTFKNRFLFAYTHTHTLPCSSLTLRVVRGEGVGQIFFFWWGGVFVSTHVLITNSSFSLTKPKCKLTTERPKNNCDRLCLSNQHTNSCFCPTDKSSDQLVP